MITCTDLKSKYLRNNRLTVKLAVSTTSAIVTPYGFSGGGAGGGGGLEEEVRRVGA